MKAQPQPVWQTLTSIAGALGLGVCIGIFIQERLDIAKLVYIEKECAAHTQKPQRQSGIGREPNDKRGPKAADLRRA